MSEQNAYLNGQFMPLLEAKISPMDRGFLFGEAVYEVLCVYGQKPFQLEAHFKRLQGSLASINLENAIDFASFSAIVFGLMQHTNYPNSTIYLQVTRGVDSKRNHLPGDKIVPTVFAFITPYEEKSIEQRAEGYHAMLEKDVRWGRCDIKATNLLPNILALMAGKKRNQECIEVLLEREGYLQEGVSSAVFIEKDSELYTPPLTSFLLPSITRQVVGHLAKLNQITVHEQPISVESLYAADNIWLASTSKEISPVITLNNQLIAKGKPTNLWFTLMEAYKALTRA